MCKIIFNFFLKLTDGKRMTLLKAVLYKIREKNLVLVFTKRLFITFKSFDHFKISYSIYIFNVTYTTIFFK